MEIEIPSPSVFLSHALALPANEPTPESTQGIARSRLPPKPTTTWSDGSAQHDEGTKPAPNKSRNGCITCKKKRLKCDETKPFCVQCKNRRKECGGYQKDYKWRSFENPAKQSRTGKAKKARNNNDQEEASTKNIMKPVENRILPYLNEQASSSPCQPHNSIFATQVIDPPTERDNLTNPPLQFSPFPSDSIQIPSSDFDLSNYDFLSYLPPPGGQLPTPRENGCSSLSTGSPALVNLPLLGAGLRNPSNQPALDLSRSSLLGEAGLDEGSLSLSIDIPDDVDFGEETWRDHAAGCAQEVFGSQWIRSVPSPADSQGSTTSSQSTDLTLFKTPLFDQSSPEMLILRFHRETCGILSIKDGPSENPWRTLIWPLAKDSQALYHAISAMAALHGTATQPQLRLTAITHMTKAISKLSAEMHEMSVDQILASVLALTLGESWDDKISTGIQHLKGAKTLLKNALAQRKKSLQLGKLTQEDAKRLKFLANTYVYLVAIARLTSNDEHDDIDLDSIVQAVNEPMGSFEYEIDPMMGCATTLFPLLGKVGSLVQKIRKTHTNSLSIISEANELREQVLQWEPPDMDLFEQPEDPSSNTRHALHTAEAYRRAILLVLHSAVTELFSEPSHDQAKATLAMLASTPLSSRTMIVQIFPLLVGSCEMTDPDDRQWIAQRWDAMMKRLTIVNVSSCWEIVKEVWRRRDRWTEMQAQRTTPMIGRKVSPGHFFPRTLNRNKNIVKGATEDAFLNKFSKRDETGYSSSSQAHKTGLTSNASDTQEPMQPLTRPPRNHTDLSLLNGEIQYSVRGHLHWLGVMSDWKWEVFL